jgi:hypothetical protein
MSKVLTSIGAKIGIGSSTTYGTKATSYTRIPQVFEMSELDLDPDTIDTTSFDNLKYKSSTTGLIDTSGIMTLTANATANEDAETVWDGMVDAYEGGSQIWLCVVIEGKTDATYIPIAPVRTGANTITLNDRITIKLKFTIQGDLLFDTAPETMTEPTT